MTTTKQLITACILLSFLFSQCFCTFVAPKRKCDGIKTGAPCIYLRFIHTFPTEQFHIPILRGVQPRLHGHCIPQVLRYRRHHLLVNPAIIHRYCSSKLHQLLYLSSRGIQEQIGHLEVVAEIYLLAE